MGDGDSQGVGGVAGWRAGGRQQAGDHEGDLRFVR
jgi:hypothetical protein